MTYYFGLNFRNSSKDLCTAQGFLVLGDSNNQHIAAVYYGENLTLASDSVMLPAVSS